MRSDSFCEAPLPSGSEKAGAIGERPGGRAPSENLGPTATEIGRVLGGERGLPNNMLSVRGCANPDSALQNIMLVVASA